MAGRSIDAAPLDVLRALADPTRNALYRTLAEAAGPLTTGQLADHVGLHPNTVRAHLDQLVTAGLVRADTVAHGGRGRPRHRFAVADRAAPRTVHPLGMPDGPRPGPGAGGDPATDELARALVEVARMAGVDPQAVRRVGQRSGRDRVRGPAASSGDQAVTESLELVSGHEERCGFDPAVESLGDGRWRLSFNSCPYRRRPDEDDGVLCSLHHGTVEGLCAGTGHLDVEDFTPTTDAHGCHAVLADAHRARRPSTPIPSQTGNKEDPT
jgi:predicted ArsR family transcriptional regulator